MCTVCGCAEAIALSPIDCNRRKPRMPLGLQEDKESQSCIAAGIPAGGLVTPARGEELPDEGYSSVPQSHRKLKVSRTTRDALVKEEGARVRDGQKKLTLVLDLDHTLLNSAHMGEGDIDEALHNHLEAIARSESNQGLLHCLPHIATWTKLRPPVFEFLTEASKFYQLYIYTMGQRGYADEMRKLLDPDGVFFGSSNNGEGMRVIAREDSTRERVKSLDVLLGTEDSVIILDDTVGVWKEYVRNVIPVDRYHYFPSSAKNFQMGPSLLERQVDEDAATGSLAVILDLLKRVHVECFREGGTPDCRDALAKEYATLLDGVVLIFTHVIDKHSKKPEKTTQWRRACKLGARVVTEVGPEVTHVVAGPTGRGTDKAKTPRPDDLCTLLFI